MLPDRPEHRRAASVHAHILALAGALLLAAAPSAAAATPEPLPPPPELLNSGGYAIDSPAVTYRYPPPGYAVPAGQPPPATSSTGDAPYDPYGTPVSSYLPPLPGQPASEVSAPYLTRQPVFQDVQRPEFSVPDLQAPPMTSLPGESAPYMAVPYMPFPAAAASSGTSGTFRASPPAAYMPEDYFNLPMTPQNDVIPGVLMPTVNEDFYDPAWVPPAQRIIRQGMSQRQLEPFFELAKGSEKAALDAKAANDDLRYRGELQNAVAGYMEIIAMADAGNDAREEAWYGVARCEYRRENWWKAFDALERSFPREFDREEVAGRIKLEMFIGERLWRLGHNAVPDARKDGGTLSGYQAASRVYAAAIFNQPNSKDAPLALLRRGDAAAMEENWEEAAKFYRSVVQYYPESEPAMQARSSLAEAVHRQEWPAGLPEAAREDLNSVMTRVEATERKLSVPAEDRRQRAAILANNHDAETMLRQAKDYMSQIKLKKSRDAAVFLLGNIVSNYPSTPQAWEAADILAGMGISPPMVLAEGNRYPITGGGESLDVDRRAGSGEARLNGERAPGAAAGVPPATAYAREPAPVSASHAPGPAPVPAPQFEPAPGYEPGALYESEVQYVPVVRPAPSVLQSGGRSGARTDDQTGGRRVKRRAPPRGEAYQGGYSPAPVSGYAGNATPRSRQPNPAEVFVPGVTPEWEE